MPRDPVLTIGDLEPERPTVAFNHNAPDGRWQAFKHRNLDVLLRWFPVRYRMRRELYPLRTPAEFGVRTLARINAAQREVAELQMSDLDDAGVRRVERLLEEVSGYVLDAPRSVIRSLTASQHIQLLLTFGVPAVGQTPTQTDAENPPTSADSSPASAASTRVTAGRTG